MGRQQENGATEVAGTVARHRAVRALEASAQRWDIEEQTTLYFLYIMWLYSNSSSILPSQDLSLMSTSAGCHTHNVVHASKCGSAGSQQHSHFRQEARAKAAHPPWLHTTIMSAPTSCAVTSRDSAMFAAERCPGMVFTVACTARPAACTTGTNDASISCRLEVASRSPYACTNCRDFQHF